MPENPGPIATHGASPNFIPNVHHMLRGTLGPSLGTWLRGSIGHGRRYYAAEALDAAAKAKADSKAFAKTLQLPNTPFPLFANAKEVEDKYRELTCDKLYKWQVCGVSL